MILEDEDIRSFESRITTASFPSTAPTYQCLFFGSRCDQIHIVSVPARIGIHVRHPRDLETRYWIRFRDSELMHILRDLRRTMKEVDSMSSDHNGNKFTVIFADQRDKDLRQNRSISKLGLLSDWLGDLMLIKHNNTTILDIQDTEVKDLSAKLIEFVYKNLEYMNQTYKFIEQLAKDMSVKD